MGRRRGNQQANTSVWERLKPASREPAHKLPLLPPRPAVGLAAEEPKGDAMDNEEAEEEDLRSTPTCSGLAAGALDGEGVRQNALCALCCMLMHQACSCGH